MPITLRRTVYPPADNKSNGYNNSSNAAYRTVASCIRLHKISLQYHYYSLYRSLCYDKIGNRMQYVNLHITNSEFSVMGYSRHRQDRVH
jgi:hypothetical protein